MTRLAQTILDSGDPFPSLRGDTVRHGPLALPDHFADRWGVLLVYRAHW